MKNCFKKHFAHYTLAMLGLGLSALSHATDAPVATGAGNITQSIAVDTDADTPAWAREQYARWRWNPGYLINPAASITINGVTSYDQPNAGYQAITAVRDQLYTYLQSSLDTEIRTELSKVRDFKWSTVSIGGPIDLNIQPGSNGQNARLSLSGLSVWIAFNFSGNLDDWFGTSWECNGSVNTGTLTINGYLDQATGDTSNTTLSLNNPITSLSCSTGYGIIPGVNFFINYFLGQGIDKFNNSIQQLKVPLKRDSFMNMDAALKQTHMGDQIKDNMPALVQSGNASIHFKPKVGRLLAPSGNISPVDPNTESGVTYIQNDEAVSISLNGGAVKLTVYDSTLFTSWYGCTGPGSCEY